MILCDAGPLIALFDKSQGEVREKSLALLPQLTTPLVTTWPSFNEVTYTLQKMGGRELVKMVRRLEGEGIVQVYPLTREDITRIKVLEDRYKGVPMDGADASLVVAAEVLNITRVFTFNEKFRLYKINDTTPFELVP